MDTEENQDSNGNSDAEGTTNPPATTPATATPAVGAKMVPEADLLAMKGSLERRITDADDRATRAEATAEESRQKVLALEAAKEQSDISASKAAQLELDLATARAETKSSVTNLESAQADTLSIRKQLIVATYNIPESQLEGKSLEQLGHFEEALKTVAAIKGVGNYAVGGGEGAAPTPTTPIEAARQTMDEVFKNSPKQ